MGGELLESQEGLKRLSLELDLDVQRRLRLESQEGLKLAQTGSPQAVIAAYN